jgi:hypothetical protein
MLWLGHHAHTRGFRPSGPGLGLPRLAEQLTPLDERADAEHQERDAAHADRDVDQQKPARHDPGNQQPDRNSHEKRTEPDHMRSPSDACGLSAYRRSREGAPSVGRKPPECGTTSGMPYWPGP